VIPILEPLSGGLHIHHRTILTQGIGESFLAEKIKSWEDNLPAHIKLAYLPSPGLVRLRLSARGGNKRLLEEELSYQINHLLSMIPEYIWGYDNDKLEAIVGNLLLEINKTVATAESCTGGYIAHRITDIPGSSACFKGAVVAYDMKVKEKVLNVSAYDLQQYSPVSQQVVEQMATGVKELLKSDYSIATTGIAGPDGGSEENPVGTIWIAIATPDKIISKRYQFGDNRDRNIIRATMAALGMLRNELVD
jgi:nicotinamide-nucleotide amidase